MSQYQITSKARHLRYVFFIDENYPYDKLLSLIHRNQRFWGGRYNPIVPVSDNKITDRYLDILKYYDPDFVFYSDKVDVEEIKKLRLFNPRGYSSLDKVPSDYDIMGVDAFYFISRWKLKSTVLMPSGLYKADSPLMQFYETNFGLDASPTVLEANISEGYDKFDVDPETLRDLNAILHSKKPINRAKLSRMAINTTLLRSKSSKLSDFEIVISKDNESIIDLLYFWNRLLFECKDVMYLTHEELKEICKDKFFGGVLYDLSSSDGIQVLSNSLSKKDVVDLIDNHLKPIAPNRTFKYQAVDEFPFKVRDRSYSNWINGDKTQTNQLIVAEKGLIFLPKLPFTEEVSFYPQKWAVDLEINRLSDWGSNAVKFPLTTAASRVVNAREGRIDFMFNISAFIHSQDKAEYLEINIPRFKDVVNQLITRPVIDGEMINTKFVRTNFHDASNRLSAFLKIFDHNFSVIEDFFTDIFWVGIFENLILNNKPSGDAIHFEDLVKECEEQLLKHRKIELGEKSKTYHNIENLQNGLKDTLTELCDYRVFLKGFKLKCPTCSSKFWYHVDEISEFITCKGCFEEFKIPVESKFAYKLNDLIKNNIFQSKKERDGNLTVVRTIARLHSRYHSSFFYSPQLNLFDNRHTNKPIADIDILCIGDGELIIGEAKHDSAAFSSENNKSLKSLAEVAKEIRPDKVILACYTDSKGKLAKAEQGLRHFFHGWDYTPEIETILLRQPDAHQMGDHRYFRD